MVWLLRVVLWGGLLWPAVGWAQARAPAERDTVVGRKLVPRLPRNRFVVQYDSRYSIINHHLTTINGLKLGLEFKSRFRTGAAIYFLSTGVPTRQAKPDNAAEDADAQLRFRYLAAYAGYVLLEKPRWELSANLQLGLGSVYVLYEADDGDLDKTPRDFLGVVEPAFAAQYRLLHWAGFGTGIGWRQPTFVPVAVQKELNGPVFYLRANVFLGELVKVLKQKDPLFSQEGLRRE
ncbi:hypothetical protein [Hymenobacter ruricola]|uniref:DUF3575 domain-containing protein n=1 Tax=Hymenobacter ruricola TaxID=2791023 RepID=A0ABS0I2P6_9BACT|nr:hypothetical protein [Hymenobacter ruricola]MBF9221046.1 hypothetical protein [Hymenobacter ruricola]